MTGHKMTVMTNCMMTANDSRMTAVNDVFFGPVVALAQKRETWSPARIARVAWCALTNISKGREILQILKLPAYAGLVRIDPRFSAKSLIRNYLVRGFTISERTACFLHHYRRLHAGMSAALLQRTLHQHVSVFESRTGDARYQITLCYARDFEKEGELSLNLYVDGAIVFVLSFNIVPGWVVQSQAAEVLLITRLQGTRGYYGQIRMATRDLHDVAPAALLLAAMQGLAHAFGIGELAGVCATRQSSYSKEFSSLYQSAYDDFFVELGAARNSAGFFVSPIPLPEKPVACVKQGHRLRTREKRAFKRQIAADVCQLLLESC
ncbi:MAG: DUF535 family protein [Terracidiphilus sp.]|jgi:hypothetical protein